MVVRGSVPVSDVDGAVRSRHAAARVRVRRAGVAPAASDSSTALLPAFALFVAWDLWASATETWGFNRAYTVGVELPGGMAIEELVFFVIDPDLRAAHDRVGAQHPVRSCPVRGCCARRARAVDDADLPAARRRGRGGRGRVSRCFVFRSGHLPPDARTGSSMAIVFAFMIPVDGWLTKLSAPIVDLPREDTSGIRPVWDIPLEEFAYAFALLTLRDPGVGSRRTPTRRHDAVLAATRRSSLIRARWRRSATHRTVG